MSATLKRNWTVEQFLEWEERQELRYEFDGVHIHAMTGGTFAHDAIQMNLIRALGNRLDGKPCRVHGSSLKIRVMGSIRYPDAFVSCAPIELTATVSAEPVVIFEIMSRSTARTDRTVKNREYGGTHSVIRYVMLEQDGPEGMMFARTGGDGWTGHVLGPDAVLHMPEIGVDLPLAEVYSGLEFPAPRRSR